jgi:hypothetical protein
MRIERDLNPVTGATIITHQLLDRRVGKREDVEWEQEEWSVRAFLVAHDPAADSLRRVLGSIRAHDVDFTPWWPEADTFNFGEASTLAGVEVFPWLYVRTHPLTDILITEPRPDFIRYHCLDRRAGKPFLEYIYPIDDIAVLRTSVTEHSFYNPTPYSAVHRDYLRDYLAAKKVALVVAVVADRFANAAEDEDLELEIVKEASISENAWITTTLHSAQQSPYGLAMGRSSLHWNLAVLPYEHPKVARSYWSYFGDDANGTDMDPPPLFTANPEGNRCALKDPGCPLYLYFRPEVLQKYLTVEGYGVAFHMRTWGAAWGPGDSSIDVGVNSKGLLTALAPDIAKLSVRDQLHWAHHSSLPDGEVCSEMWETRMQQRPPHSPSVPEVIRTARSGLNDAIERRFGETLYVEVELDRRAVQRMSVGPLIKDIREVTELGKTLFAWVVESIDIASLRRALDAAGLAYDPGARQIVLLRTLVAGVANINESDARSLTAPLSGLNELRTAAAHPLHSDFDAALTLFHIDPETASPRDTWDIVVESVAAALHQITVFLS